MGRTYQAMNGNWYDESTGQQVAPPSGASSSPTTYQQNIPAPQVNTGGILAPILSGQVPPGSINQYLNDAVLGLYRSTYNGGSGDNTYLNQFSANGQAQIAALKASLEGQTMTIGGQTYKFENGGAVKTTPTINQTVVNGSGRYTNSTGNGAVSSYSGPSIVDYLSSIGKPNDMTSRKALAAQYGIQNYVGTADQNTQLLNILRNGATSGTTSPVATNTGSTGLTANEQALKNYYTANPPTPDQIANINKFSPGLLDKLGLSGGSAAGNTTGGPTGNTGGTVAGLPSTGNENLDSILTGLNSYIQNQLTQGFAVNPSLQITPEMASQFVSQAHTQVDPYYQQLITDEITGINASLGKLSTDYKNTQGGEIANFQENLANTRESAGGSGTAFSGGRGLKESNMLNAENRTLSGIDNNYAYNVGNLLRTGAGNVGAGAPGLSGSSANFALPDSLGTTRASLAGPRGGSVSGGALDFAYNPSVYTYGSIPSNYGSALATQSNQFLSSYLKGASNNSARSFQNINGTLNLM